jgi:hypothetical protein
MSDIRTQSEYTVMSRTLKKLIHYCSMCGCMFSMPLLAARMFVSCIFLFSGGESKNDFWKMVHLSTDLLPEDKPRYLMGVGFATDLVVCCALGVDMFDCVFPTRTAVRMNTEKLTDNFLYQFVL